MEGGIIGGKDSTSLTSRNEYIPPSSPPSIRRTRTPATPLNLHLASSGVGQICQVNRFTSFKVPR
jgi:hypothetical protein